MHSKVALSRTLSTGPQPPGQPQHAVCLRPYFGESHYGDGVVMRAEGDSWLMAVIDVLGHGREAHELARDMENWLREQPLSDVGSTMRGLHQRFQGRRGAAVCLARVDGDGVLSCVSVGNTLLRVLKPSLLELPGQPGTVGQILPRLSEQYVQLSAGNLLLFTTDGVQEHIPHGELERLAGLTPGRLCHQLMNAYGKWHDDATCFAVRWPS